MNTGARYGLKKNTTDTVLYVIVYKLLTNLTSEVIAN